MKNKKRTFRIILFSFFVFLISIFFIYPFIFQKEKFSNNKLISNNQNFINTNNIDIGDDLKWISSIKESTSNNTVKLFFTRNASLVFQQSLLVLNYMLNNNINKNYISFFVDKKDVYDLNKFDFSLFENNTQIKDNFLLIKNLDEIPNNGLLDNPSQDYNTVPTPEMIGAILNYYLNIFGENVKFDIWIPDVSLNAIWESKSNQLYDLLPYVNKIYLLSDGSGQLYSFVDDYINRFKLKQYTKDESLNIFNTITNKGLHNSVDSINAYRNSSSYDFLRLNNMFTIFHIAKYTESPYFDLSINDMYEVSRFNYDYFDMSEKLYTSSLEINNKDTYVNDYEKFFKISNNNLESFVFKGFEFYDPNKKNIIWMGDSLIRSKDNVNYDRAEEIQKTFLALTKKYDPNEYNYFFKHHPRYNKEQQYELTNFISKGTLVNPIYFNNFPWELFLSWDKKNQKNSDYIPFFSNDSNSDSIPKTQLVGIQYTSTTIIATYFFIISQYNMNSTDSWKSINYKNFPVPGTFDIVDINTYNKFPYLDQVKINKEKTNKIYGPFISLNYLPFYYDDQKDTSEILDEFSIKYDFTHKQTISLENNNFFIVENLSNIIFYIFLLISFIFLVLIFFIFFKNRKSKIKK